MQITVILFRFLHPSVAAPYRNRMQPYPWIRYGTVIEKCVLGGRNTKCKKNI